MVGGPEYQIVLQGESGEIKYEISSKEIDFGEILFNEYSVNEFSIENKGKVPFEFNLSTELLSRENIVEVYPT